MAAIQRKRVYGPFTGGLNDKLSPIMIDQSEGAELVNFQVNDRGILEKYKGYQKDHAPFPDDADSFIRFMLNYKKGSTVDLLLMAARDDGNTNATYKVDFKKTAGDGTSAYIGHTAGTNASFTNGNTAVTGTGTAWLSHLKAGDKIKATAHADGVYAEIQSVNSDTSITLTANYSGATASNVAYIARIVLHKDFIPRGIVFNNKAIITNGSERPMSFDNDTLNKLTDSDAPSAYYVEAHKSRVFMAGTSSYPSRLYWSAVNDETAWDATSYEDVFPQDNGVIIAIKSFGDSLIVLKNNGRVYQIVGNFDESSEGEIDFIRKVDVIENVGTISEKSPVVHNNFLYFMTSTGIYRLDQRLFMEKVSYGADNFVSGLNFASGPVANKTYTYDTNSQWDDGTHLGTLAKDGKLVLPFYSHTTSNVLEPASNGPTVFSSQVDDNNDTHVAYVNTSGNVIYYTVESETNTKSAETTVYSGGLATHCSISIKPSTDTPGISYGTSSNLVYLTEYSGGSWGAAENITAAVNVVTYTFSGLQAWDFKYGSDDSKFLLISFSSATGSPSGSLASGMYVIKKSGSAWNYCAGSTSSATSTVYGGVMCTDHVNAKIFAAYSFYSSSISSKKIFISQIAVATGADENTASPAQTPTTPAYSGEKMFVGVDSSGVGAVAFTWPDLYSDNRVLYQNLSGATATLVAATSSFKGFWVEGTTKVVWYTTGTGSSVTEKILNGATTITFATTGGASTSTTANFGSAQNQNATRITSLSYLTQDSGVVKCYQLSANGVHTTDEESDATLTAWGTLEAEEELNGNTAVYSVALNTVSPATSFNTVGNGQIISSDATKIFIIAKATLTLGAFAPLEIESLNLNFVGTGIDAKQPVGISFDTELYYAVAETSDTANAHVIVQDTEDKLLKLSYPVSLFERFKNKLYAGKSTNGDLLILKQGYNFGAVATAYTADFQSKEDFLDAIELEKDIYKFYILYEVKSTGTFDFSYRTDSFATSGGTAWTSSTIDQTDAGIAEVKVGKKCRSIQFRVENDNSDEQVGIIAVVLVYGLLNIR